jgi:hypothetical protein
MKKIIITLLIVSFTQVICLGQNKQYARIEAEKIAFFTLRMDLSPDEAKDFWPVYNEFNEKRNQLKKEKNALLRRNTLTEEESIDEKELEKNGDRLIEYMIEEAELTKEYHQKFKKILPAGKVLRIYQTETQFNRILLEQLRTQRSQQNVARRR